MGWDGMGLADNKRVSRGRELGVDRWTSVQYTESITKPPGGLRVHLES